MLKNTYIDSVKKILVVDDNVQMLKFSQNELVNEQCQVSVSQSVSDAQNMLSCNHFSHVFVDSILGIGSDKSDGVSFVKDVRNNNVSTFICMLARDHNVEMLFRSLLAGANDCIWKSSSKPSPILQMKRIIEHLSLPQTSRFREQNWGKSILRTRGLCGSQIQLLRQYTSSGFPDICVFSDIVNISENALVKRFSRIEKTMGLKNRAELIQLLTISSGYVGV